MIENFIEIQLIQFRIIITKFVNLNLSNSFDLSRESKVLEQNINNIINNNKTTSRFFNNNIEFFDLFYNSKFNKTILKIKHARKKIYFKNIIIFIDKIKDVIRVKKIELLRNNLQIYL